MTQTPTPPTETLDELLAETRRYAGYLEKLEERREGTPAHLYARLHDEYQTRLADLRLRAAVEAEALAEGLVEDEAAVRDAEARLAEAEEERAEGELRAAVGELDPRVWAKRLNGLNAQVASIGGERDALVVALAHRRALLEEVRGQRGMVPGVPSDRPPRVSFASPAFGGASPDQPPPRGTIAMTESMFPPAPPAVSPAVVAPEPPMREEPSAGRVSRPAAISSDIGLFDEVELMRPPPTSPVERSESAGRVDGDAKSLKCHECGTLNFSTEWYCERCGGELAAD